jgi:hypothetical protein
MFTFTHQPSRRQRHQRKQSLVIQPSIVQHHANSEYRKALAHSFESPAASSSSSRRDISQGGDGSGVQSDGPAMLTIY